MKTFKSSIIILLALILNIKANSQASEKIVEEFVAQTKFGIDLSQIDDVLDVKLNEKINELNEKEVKEKFSKILKENFNSTKANQYLRDYLIRNQDEEKLKELIDLYKKPIMVKMNNLEQGFYDPNDKDNQLLFFKEMKSNPPKKERIDLLIKLNLTLQAAKRTENLLKKIMIVIAKSYNLINDTNESLSPSELENKINSQLPENISQQITNQFVAIGLYTYRLTSDEELLKYIEIFETDLGKYYVNLTFNTYEFIFEQLSEELIINLNRSF